MLLKGLCRKVSRKLTNLKKCQAAVFQVHAIAVEIRHNPFNPGVLYS